MIAGRERLYERPSDYSECWGPELITTAIHLGDRKQLTVHKNHAAQSSSTKKVNSKNREIKIRSGTANSENKCRL